MVPAPQNPIFMNFSPYTSGAVPRKREQKLTKVAASRRAAATFDISRGMRLQELEAVSQKMRQPENKRGPEGEEKDTQGQRHQVGKHCQGHSFHRNFCQP